ncbi:MAG TPA: DUF2924 domain-containing protein [Gemmataceae bacterium]|nr:DUF2924 domain-containing protein [Gemmataceae bacterium]
MDPAIAKEVAALPRLSFADLRARYAELFHEPTRAGNRVWLIRRIAWRLQALAEGDLSDRARQRAAELAKDADLRLMPPNAVDPARPPAAPQAASPRVGPPQADPRVPPPGSFITRVYKGQTLQIEVLPSGFAHQGTVYPSLSAVAKAITGSHCSGFLFFRLHQELNHQGTTHE